MRQSSLKLYLNLLFVFIPKYWLIAIIIASIALIYGSIYAMLGYMVLNAAIFMVSIELALVVHELGHWLGARLVGEYPRRIEIGTGHVVLKTDFFRTKLTIKDKLKTGYVLTIFNNHKHYRLRRGIYVSMGPVANLVLAGVYFMVFPLSYSFDASICAAYIGGLFNILLFIGNILPFKTTVAGLKQKSDGLQIWNLIFNKKQEPDFDDQLINDFLDGYDALEESDYKKALELLEICIMRAEGQNVIVWNACKVNIGVCKGRLGDLDGYYIYMKQVEAELKDEKLMQLAGPVYHNIAFIHLLRGELIEAEQYIQKAMGVSSAEPEVRMVNAAIAVSKGDFEGTVVLEDMIDMHYPTGQNVFAAMYLAMAYSEQGKEKLKNKYWSFVEKNELLLTQEVRPVYQELSGKIGS